MRHIALQKVPRYLGRYVASKTTPSKWTTIGKGPLACGILPAPYHLNTNSAGFPASQLCKVRPGMPGFSV